jgi:predicted transglutaminase-like cysteine proteinase
MTKLLSTLLVAVVALIGVNAHAASHAGAAPAMKASDAASAPAKKASDAKKKVAKKAAKKASDAK